MLRLGLTGGIASGKSLVASELRQLGFRVLDADRIGHELLAPDQSAYEPVIQEFGAGILRPDKSVDRKKLGAIVFADGGRLKILNSILHPRIEEAIDAKFLQWGKEDSRDPVFVEAALLIEAGMHKRLDGLVVVWCKPEQQVDRLVARGLSEKEARHRVSLQMTNNEKLKFAMHRIDTSGTMQQTQQQVSALAKTLRASET